jgi:excisionase family DNA binding protein
VASVSPSRLVLTVREAADQLRISEAAMWRLIAADQLRTVKIGRCRRIPAAALEDYISRLMEASER